MTLSSFFLILSIEVTITKNFFQNKDFFKENQNNHYHLNKKRTFGQLFLPFLVAGAVTSSITSHETSQNIEPIVAPFSVNMETSDLNNLNIIINDNDCSDAFFSDVCEQLREDGISFSTTQNGFDINQNNGTVITLDQQYSSGSSTLIFAPYNNARVGHSDSLALAMHCAFDQNGFVVDDLLCAKVGYEEDENGNVNYFVPTDTERSIDEGNDTSFVTISFGTQNVNAKWVAKSIENGLARQKYYLENYDKHSDLIYRASSSDSLDIVSEYFGAEPYRLRAFNHMPTAQFQDSQAIINPSVSEYDVFNRDSMFQIDGEKTRAY